MANMAQCPPPTVVKLDVNELNMKVMELQNEIKLKDSIAKREHQVLEDRITLLKDNLLKSQQERDRALLAEQEQRAHAMKVVTEVMQTTAETLEKCRKEQTLLEEKVSSMQQELLKEVREKADIQKQRDNLLVWKGLFQSFAKDQFVQCKAIMGEDTPQMFSLEGDQEK